MHYIYKPLYNILSIAVQFGEFCYIFVSHTTTLLCIIQYRQWHRQVDLNHYIMSQSHVCYHYIIAVYSGLVFNTI